MALELTGGDYRAAIDPDRGATLVGLAWTGPDGPAFELLHRCPGDVPAQGCGSFVMAPFTNRIAGARFEFEGRTIVLPMNRPEEGLAIHGFSRDRAWQVLDSGAGRLRARDCFRDPDSDFAYDLTQTVTLDRQGVEIRLELVNRGDRRLPFGIGLHPWFAKEAETVLRFVAATQFGRTAQGFADAPAPVAPGEGFAAGIDVSRIAWLDSHFAGWHPRTASLEWRRRGIRLDLTASGAFGNLHVYVPDDRPVVCVEPVSHVPDVHNRRDFAAYGDLAVLDPGGRLEGGLRLTVSGIV